MDDHVRAYRDLCAQSLPKILDEPEQAIRTIHHCAAQADALLQELGESQHRPSQQRAFAKEVREACRSCRLALMQKHAGWIYENLTQGKNFRLRAEQLVESAAEIFPGLVPTREQMQRENCLSQVDKEGWEIDQGIFFWGVLHHPESGQHLIKSMLRPLESSMRALEFFRVHDFVDFGSVRVSRKGRIAHVTLQNTATLNAEDNAMIESMEAAVDVVLLDDRVSVCVIRGGYSTHPKYLGKRVFCAGINLKHLVNGKISFVRFLLTRELGYVNKIANGIILDGTSQKPICTVQKPWLAAVESFAIGGGAQLLLVVDHVIAASNSYISLPAAKEGLIPGAANLRLAQAVGRRLSRQMILLGKKIAATDPDARWLVDEIADPARMDSIIEESAARFDSSAVHANRRMLALAEDAEGQFRQYMAEFAREQSARLYNLDIFRSAPY